MAKIQITTKDKLAHDPKALQAQFSEIVRLIRTERNELLSKCFISC